MMIIKFAVGVGGGFSFTLTAPRAKRLHRCQTTAIIVVVFMLEVAAVDVVGLISLSSLADLDLYLVPPPIVIYPALYRFDLDLDLHPISDPGLDRH